jgi:catalase-peroxidase
MDLSKLYKKTAIATLLTLLLTPPIAISQDAAELTNDSKSSSMQKSKPPRLKSNLFWWPNQLDLSLLRNNNKNNNPLGDDFNYAAAFNELNLNAVKKDIDNILTTSQDWWPADWGNYGPFFIRMAWHGAGTYRTLDGRGGGDGGQMRFDPLNSWPDNANLDKARRLLWPVKQKYGRSISWGDLIALTGNVALENMGFETYGFAGGRNDDWQPDMVYWGPEVEMLASERHKKDGDLITPLGATHMGLIYVNPEGPKGVPDPMASAKNIRKAFARMAMNDEETVALIAGGHTFGKTHGAHKPTDCLDREPGAATIENQGFGWQNKCGKGHSEDTVTSGLEGAWTQLPTKFTTLYLSNLLDNEWGLSQSPAGAKQWIPKNKDLHQTVPDAHIKDKFNSPVMLTTDLALKFDPEYKKITERFLKNPDDFKKAFAKAWFKLIHRDMGPRNRYLGPEVPKEVLLWQDPIPEVDYALISDSDAEDLKQQIIATDLTVTELVRTAWASASSYRASDMRGGANGARVRLLPQTEWAVNNASEINKVVTELQKIQDDFNDSFFSSKKVSIADLIVLAGNAAIEKAAKDAGVEITVPFVPGRADATQEQTDVESFGQLEPKADAFRNYFNNKESYLSPSEMLVDKANQLNLTVPEMTVLLGGMRALNVNTADSKHGVFTNKPGTLNNDFFINLLDMSTKWQKSKTEGVYEGLDRKTSAVKYTATEVDLIFGANPELRAVAEVYAFNDAKQYFVKDFVNAWAKVMNLDRFDQ